MNGVAGDGVQKDFKKMLTISLLFHLLIFLPLFILSMKRSTLIIYSPVYTVDLVDAAPRARKKSAAGKLRKSPAKKKKNDRAARKKKEMETLQTKLAELQKKKTVGEKEVMAELQAKVKALKAKKSKEILDEKVRKIEESLKEKEETDKLIQDIQSKIAALRTSRENGRGEGEKDTSREKPSHRGMKGKENLLMSPRVKAYLNLLDQTVRGAWSVPRALLDNRDDLMVQLRISIEEDGGVSSIIVERPSDNRLFDASVLRAINKAAPLPVPPESLREGRDYYEVGFRFHYFPER